MKNNSITTIDDYIAMFPPDVQEMLKAIRRTIQQAAPEAKETIKYQMPTFTLQGNLVYFAAYKKHIGFYPSSSGIAAFQKEFSKYAWSKGAVQFPLDEPMPLGLIGDIVKFRVQENLAKVTRKPAKENKSVQGGFPKTTFSTTIMASGNNTGIEVPDRNIAELGQSKKPAVSVNIGIYRYSSTVAVMGGKFMIPLSKAHREAAGLKAGDKVKVTLEAETTPRVVNIPDDLAKALHAAKVKDGFEALSASKRKEFVRQVEDAKTQETRERRIEKIVVQLSQALKV